MNNSISQEIMQAGNFWQYLYKNGSKEFGIRLIEAATIYRNSLPKGLLTNYYDQPPIIIADKIIKFGKELVDYDISPSDLENETISSQEKNLNDALSKFEKTVFPTLELLNEAFSCLGHILERIRTFKELINRGDRDLGGISAKPSADYILQKIERSYERGPWSEFIKNLENFSFAIQSDLEQVAYHYGARITPPNNFHSVLRPAAFRAAAEKLSLHPYSKEELNTAIESLINAAQDIIDTDQKQEDQKKEIYAMINDLTLEVEIDIYHVSYFAHKHGILPCQ
ncbi:hypothetical protein QU487_02565 [Crenobacter sp. SG2305]|uniref:hypothetical protein n=1 Tax=Crenobacter oryzisoli TaxID=3056844 RepID=UPI0025AA9945|nr:hypothetical protein [Crenobacter sp. SG2305]MDN0081644.1 hypothetical protein [Crenobacter sp. SG2305]